MFALGISLVAVLKEKNAFPSTKLFTLFHADRSQPFHLSTEPRALLKGCISVITKQSISAGCRKPSLISIPPEVT